MHSRLYVINRLHNGIFCTSHNKDLIDKFYLNIIVQRSFFKNTFCHALLNTCSHSVAVFRFASRHYKSETDCMVYRLACSSIQDHSKPQ